MDKKKWSFIAIALAMVLIVVGIVLSTIKKDDSKVASAPEVREETPPAEEEVDKHADYVQDADNDPFLGVKTDTGELTVDTLTFDFESITGASYEHTAATLIDATDNFLLYHNYNNVLSFYDRTRDDRKVLAEHFNQAIITPDEQYILYTKNAFNKETFYYLDLKTFQNKEFATYLHDLRMKVIDMKYQNGLVYFLVEETESGNTSVHFVALPAYNDSFTARQRNDIIPIQTKELYQFNDKIYAFNYGTNNVDEIKPLNQPTTRISIPSEKVKNIRSVDITNENKWIVSYMNDKDEYVILTPNERITEYKGLMSAHWIDEEHLVVNDNLSLYLYNVTTKKSHVLKTGISYVFPSQHQAIIQTDDGSILRLTQKE